MNKKEFLDGLREQLTGQMTEEKIQSHVRYYQEYIEIQMKNGKSEAEAVESLGIPQLIAKTLIDTEAVDVQERDVYDENEYAYDSDDYGKYQTKHRTWHIDLNTWYGKLLVIGIAILIIAALIFVIGTIVPILLVAFLIVSAISYLKRRNR